MEGLNSPSVYNPATLNEYSETALEIQDGELYAGCTSITRRKDFYPEKKSNLKIINLSSIVELQRFSRNDKIIELGSGITLESIIKNNKQNTLPPILYKNILSIGDPVNISHPFGKKENKDPFDSLISLGSSFVTSSSTLGGAIASRDPITSIPGTLLLLDANVEIRYIKRKKENNNVKTKWFDIKGLINDGKGKCIFLHPLSLITRIRFTSYAPSISFFMENGDYLEDPENMVIMAFTSEEGQDNLVSPRLALTFPTRGIVSSKDLDNVFLQLHFPLFEKDIKSLSEIVLTFVNAELDKISPLQEKRLINLLNTLIETINTKKLSEEIGEEKI